MRAVLLASLVALAASCREEDTYVGPPVNADLAGSHGPAAQFLPETFEELYPHFLWRKSMSQGEKAKMWQRYRGRWVRWEGVVASITNKGITVKHLRATVTFDVSLTCEAQVVPMLKKRFATGDRVRYVGLLESFDDIFRTMYLSHGVVIEKLEHADLGTVPDLAHAVPTP